MRVTGFMLFCEDIRNMTAFYRDVVGLPPDDPQPFPAHKFFRFKTGDGPSLCLHSGTKPNGGRQKLMMYCDDLPGLFQRLKSVRRGFRAPKPNDRGKVVFDFYDPERNRIQVCGHLGKAKP